MLLLHAVNLKKEYADRVILLVEAFTLYQGDKVGVVGANGAGKSTFLDLLAGEKEPDKGSVTRYSDISYFHQFPQETPDAAMIRQSKLGSELILDQSIESPKASCGERIRIQLAEIFSAPRGIIFLDEPTSNLDAAGMRVLRKYLEAVETFMLICHDRSLLDACCNSILEINQGNVTQYAGNYSDYTRQKDMEAQLAWFEYEAYAKEKERLLMLKRDQMLMANRMRKKPKDKGQQIGKESGGGRSKSTQEKSMARFAKSVQSRIERLEVKGKPRELPKVQLDFALTSPPENRFVLQINHLRFGYENRVLFHDLTLSVENGEKIAIVGDNGVGKSTLLTLISTGHEGIYTVPKLKIGYLHQDFSQINFEKTVLENVLLGSVQKITVVRTLLARMLFSEKDLNKIAGVLSGGERIRLGLSMLMLSTNNMLILDEPTNFLDIRSIEALERTVLDYPGTLLFVSHDERFVRTVATRVLRLEGGNIYEV